MSALLQAELLKLRTTRTFFALTGTALALSLLIVVLTLLLSDSLTATDVRDLSTADFTSLFILLLGVMGMAGEWRHRTITSTVLAAPDRIRLLAAKVLAYAIAGAVLSLIVTATVILVGVILASVKDHPLPDLADYADVLWRNLLIAALMGAFGVCVGAIVRNQVVAIIGLLFFSFIVESTVFALEPSVGRFGPTTAPNGIASGELLEDSDFEYLEPLAAVAVMLGWISLGFAAGAALLRSRDLT